MTTTAEKLVQPLLNSLVPIPAVQRNVCPVCRTAKGGPSYPTCLSCNSTGWDGPDVLPITMSIGRGQIHRHLRNYKDGPTPAIQTASTRTLAALVSRFLPRHAACIGEFDVITAVPSPGRTAPDRILSLLSAVADRHEALLEAPGRAMFNVTRSITGQRVLIFDDTFTKGSSLLAAVRAVRAAGGEVIGPLVIGRHINREYPPSRPLIEQLERVPFDESRCGRCGGIYLDGPFGNDALF